MEERTLFHWADYLLFAVSLAVTIAIGIYYAVKDGWRTQNAESYLLGNRQLNSVLNAFSTVATIITSTVVVGVPAELYYLGVEYMWACIGVFLAAVYTALVTIPKFRNLGMEITSGYEYIERRFHRSLRMFSVFIYCMVLMLYLSAILYGPAVTFAHVTGIHILWGIAVPSLANLVYTVLGGIQAIVLVDTIQLMILVVGVIIMAIMGSVQAGGFYVLYENYKAGERNNWNDIRPDPWQRHTVWNLIFLGGLLQAVAQGAHQMYTQRYFSVASLKKAQLSMFMMPFMFFLFAFLIWITSMLAYYLFGQCEPLATGQIKRPDEMLALTIMTVLGDAHGVPGLIVAAAFAAGLSTLSSGINSLAAVFLEDFVRPCNYLVTKREISGAQAGKIVRYSSLVFAVLIWVISMGVPYMGINLTTLTYSVMSCVSTPIFGIFFLGWFVPWSETIGVFIGYICSTVFTLTMFIGSLFYATKIGFEPRPISVKGCPRPNVTNVIRTTTTTTTTLATFTTTPKPPPPEPNFFDTSYLWYTFSGLVVMIVVALIVSALVQCIKYNGRPPWGKICKGVNRNFLYTMDDLYFAVGKRKVCEISESPDRTKTAAAYDNEAFRTKDGLYKRRTGDVPMHAEKPGEENPAYEEENHI